MDVSALRAWVGRLRFSGFLKDRGPSIYLSDTGTFAIEPGELSVNKLFCSFLHALCVCDPMSAGKFVQAPAWEQIIESESLVNCVLCNRLTNGSVGAAGIRWSRICQPCKDQEDAAALST